MAEFPSLPLWTDAYLGDTTHLTTVEHGAYLLLLMVMWRTKDKCLPDDDKLLARYTRLTPAQWKRIAPTIRDFFKVENGQLTQGRLTDEANAVKRYKKRQSQAGKASALKRKERHSTTVKSGCAVVATPTPTPTPNILPPNGGCASGDALTPDEVVEDWNELAGQYGLSKVRKLTDSRRRRLLTRLRQYPEIEDWQRAFAEIAKNKWMHGDNKTGWRADFDFLLQDKSFTKLTEGAYGQAD